MSTDHPCPNACTEVTPQPCVLIIFGITGDLALRKLIPSLFQLHTQQLLHHQSFIVGCGRSEHDKTFFYKIIAEQLVNASSELRMTFMARCSYVQINTAETETFISLAIHISTLENNTPLNHLFYLAVPPPSYPLIITRLAEAHLLEDSSTQPTHNHLILEKPFGDDAISAANLNALLMRHVSEHQLFRIDHYLGKDTVQNILMLRFANAMFEPIWNTNYIDHLEITVAETLGVEHRAAYYENAGVLRDMFQNHLLELLALTTMEAPTAFTADAIQTAKLALIKSIQPFACKTFAADIVRGQYIANQNYAAYRAEVGVSPESTIETFMAAKFSINTPRWQNVPIYIRSGKRLATRTSTITIIFKPSTYKLFGANATNLLLIKIQPDACVKIKLQAKQYGPKLCMGSMPLTFNYDYAGNKSKSLDDYARLLLDAMLHDHTLFVRSETIAAAWQLFTPVLNVWRESPTVCPLHPYLVGSEGPAAAIELLARANRQWQPLL